jgi:hypothetical protein
MNKIGSKKIKPIPVGALKGVKNAGPSQPTQIGRGVSTKSKPLRRGS